MPRIASHFSQFFADSSGTWSFGHFSLTSLINKAFQPTALSLTFFASFCVNSRDYCLWKSQKHSKLCNAQNNHLAPPTKPSLSKSLCFMMMVTFCCFDPQINNQVLYGRSHQNASAIIKSAASKVKLVLLRWENMSNTHTNTTQVMPLFSYCTIIFSTVQKS